MTLAYLMESAREPERLRVKSDLESTKEQLKWSGLSALPKGAVAVDAGSGIGIGALAMASLRPDLHIHLLDGSGDRLMEARETVQKVSAHYEFVECELTQIPLKTHSVDYLFCRFVFEYLSDPKAVFREFTRIVRPGGQMVIGDLDQNCLNHFPLDDLTQRRLTELASVLAQRSVFDPFAGRKLYKLYHDAGFQEIRVEVIAHHLFYGPLAEADEFNWAIKLDRMIELQKAGALSLSYDIQEFKSDFMSFLKRTDRFSYTPLILVSGRSPEGESRG